MIRHSKGHTYLSSAPKKAIVIITCSFRALSGLERALSQLANEWARCGHSITIVVTEDTDAKPFFQTSDTIRFIYAPKPRKNPIIQLLSKHRWLARIMEGMPNATVVAFAPGAIFSCGVLSFSIKNRIVCSERNDPTVTPRSAIRRALRTWALGRADVCVFQTEFAKNLFPQRIQRKSVVIPNPISADLPSPHSGVRAKAIVSTCRLDSQKNIPLSIAAFTKLHEDHPDYVFDVYGEGNLHDDLQQLIESKGLGQFVRLRGFEQHIYEKVNEATMFVSTSDYEGMSNSMLEALALGVPSIVTDCPVYSARDVVKNNVNGLLIPVGDVEACYHAMKRIIEEPGLAENLSNEAVKIRERLPLSAIARQWTDLM